MDPDYFFYIVDEWGYLISIPQGMLRAQWVISASPYGGFADYNDFAERYAV